MHLLVAKAAMLLISTVPVAADTPLCGASRRGPTPSHPTQRCNRVQSLHVVAHGLSRGLAISSLAPVLQAFCYGGLDICTKVFFGWAIIAMGPILARQNEVEYQKYAPPHWTVLLQSVL